MKKDNKKIIIDLVNKIKYEVTEEQMAELSGCATALSDFEFADWHARIDNLDLSSGHSGRSGDEMSAQLRELLHRIVSMTREIGGRAVKIGKRIIKWIFAMLERFPRTAKALVILAALAFIVANIPLLHYILLPVVQVVGTCIIGYILLVESIGNVAVHVRELYG